MREIQPFASRRELEQAIDNGGRFYNIFSSAGDDVVTAGELSRAAGVLTGGGQAFLFLDLAAWNLSEHDREAVALMLEPDLQTRYRSSRPRVLSPAELDSRGTPGEAVIVEGWPRFTEDKTQFSGFIMVPIMIGTTTTYSMVPIHQQFAVYELFADPGREGPAAIVATPTGQPGFDGSAAIRFGGVLKELQRKDEPEPPHRLYLEAAFYSVVRSGGA